MTPKICDIYFPYRNWNENDTYVIPVRTLVGILGHDLNTRFTCFFSFLCHFLLLGFSQFCLFHCNYTTREFNLPFNFDLAFTLIQTYNFDGFKFKCQTPILNLIIHFLLFETRHLAKFLLVLTVALSLLLALFFVSFFVHSRLLLILLKVQTLHFLSTLFAIFDSFSLSLDNQFIQQLPWLSYNLLILLLELLLLYPMHLQKSSRNTSKYAIKSQNSNGYNNTLTIPINYDYIVVFGYVSIQ